MSARGHPLLIFLGYKAHAPLQRGQPGTARDAARASTCVKSPPLSVDGTDVPLTNGMPQTSSLLRPG